MEIPTILPTLGASVSTDVLNLEALNDASLGEILHAKAVLASIVTERLADPETLNQLATFGDADGADWSGFQPSADQETHGQQAEPQPQSAGEPKGSALSGPVGPDNYCDTLPAIGHMLRQITRFQDASLAHYSRYLEVAVQNQRTYLGTRYKDSHFKDPAEYLVDTMRISRNSARKVVKRGRYFAQRPGETHGHKEAQPIFQDLAQSLTAGRLPIENADRIIALDEDLTKYSQKTQQPIDRKNQALQKFEPTMVEAGEAATPDELSKAKHRWLNHIAHWVCPDGPSPAEARVKEADNELRMREHGDGSTTYSMHVTSEASIVMKNFMLHQLNFNGAPVRISKRVLNLLNVFKNSADGQNVSPESDSSDQAEPGADSSSSESVHESESPGACGDKTQRGRKDPQVEASEQNDADQNLGAVLGPLETWDTQPEPATVVAEDSHGEPVRANQIDLLDHLTTGQRMGAILVSLMYNMVTLDPNILGAKKAHGALARLTIVQDIETAHHTLGLEKIPEEARRPEGPDGLVPAVIRRPNPDTSDPPPTGESSSNLSGTSRLNGTGPPEKYPWTPYQSEAVNIGPIHQKDAELFVCNSELVGQIWDGPDTVLQEKRAKRLFTVAQRRAIIARDKGCQAPGCTMPAVHCQIHHIKEWFDGGTTDETNAVTLCPRHHAAVHNDKWKIRRHNGLIFFQPAPWLDPTQPLLRNIYWNI